MDIAVLVILDHLLHFQPIPLSVPVTPTANITPVLRYLPKNLEPQYWDRPVLLSIGYIQVDGCRPHRRRNQSGRLYRAYLGLPQLVHYAARHLDAENLSSTASLSTLLKAHLKVVYQLNRGSLRHLAPRHLQCRARHPLSHPRRRQCLHPPHHSPSLLEPHLRQPKLDINRGSEEM